MSRANSSDAVAATCVGSVGCCVFEDRPAKTTVARRRKPNPAGERHELLWFGAMIEAQHRIHHLVWGGVQNGRPSHPNPTFGL